MVMGLARVANDGAEYERTREAAFRKQILCCHNEYARLWTKQESNLHDHARDRSMVRN